MLGVVESGRILLVDDDRALRDAVGRALRLEGHEVIIASDGQEALRVLAVETVDLVVLDVAMPGMSGIDVCRRLRATGDRASVPLTLTARDAVGDRVEGLDAGADDYLVKPFALDELLARARAGVRRRATASPRRRPGSGSLSFVTCGWMSTPSWPFGARGVLTRQEPSSCCSNCSSRIPGRCLCAA